MNKPTGIEKRSFEVRAAEDEEYVLSGYAATFDTLSNDLGGFKETIAPGAFDRSLKSGQDVLCTHQHSFDKPLARLKNGSLQLSTDARGLKFRAQLDKGSAVHREVFRAVKSGLVDECSFSFRCGAADQKWNAAGNERTVTNADLLEIAVVSLPAYPGTSASARTAETTGPNTEGLARLAQIDLAYIGNKQ